MKKMLAVKNNIIVILCVTIILMGIGFVFVSVKLENIKNMDQTFDVSFTNFRQITSIKGGIVEPSVKLKISDNGKILSFNYDMYTEHDEIDYEIIITNNGSIPAVINELMMSPDFKDNNVLNTISPISVSISDISGKLLEPGEDAIVKFSVIYNSSAFSGHKNINGKIGIISESKN